MLPATHHLPDNTPAPIHAAPLGGGLLSYTANALPNETPSALLQRLTDAATSNAAHPIQGTIFCDPTNPDAKNLTAAAAGAAAPTENCKLKTENCGGEAAAAAFPISCLGRHDTPRNNVLGARITALPAGTFERVKNDHGAPCGARWETPHARYLLLGALTPPDTTAERDEQATALWHTLKTHLAAAALDTRHLARTWFYNDYILDWYSAFNRARNAFFTANNIFAPGALVPASTGIGASNSANAALTLDALAIAPKKTTPLSITAVPSPLQCPAYDYKSAFSRAVEFTDPTGQRHLAISGTASIEPNGRTAHPGDLDAQIDLTLRVVGAILESRNMTWRDTARSILYFPKLEWMPRWQARRAALGIPDIPAIYAHTDICRDDLLFELELDATTTKAA